MKKTFTCIVLILLMTIGTLPIPASAAEVEEYAPTAMTYITLYNGEMPKVGRKPCRTFDLSESEKEMYAIHSLSWWDLTDQRIIPAGSSETFQSGKTYALSATFIGVGDYRFTIELDNIAINFTRHLNEPENYGMVNQVTYNLDNSEGASIRRIYACFRMEGDNTRTVCFKPNGGKDYMLPVCVSTETKYTLPGCTLTPPESGLMFYGWGEKLPGESIWITQDTQLEAGWVTDNSGKEKVSSVGINLNKAPKIGNTPDTGFTSASSKYTAGGLYWYDNYLDREMLSHETFKAGRSYTLCVSYRPKDGYYFADINDMTASLGNVTQHKFSYMIREAGNYGYPNRFVEYQFDGLPENITNIGASIYKPLTGSKPNYTAKTDYSAVFGIVERWYEGGTASSPGRVISSSETFKAGTVYIAEAVFSVKVDSVFADGAVKCRFNGNAAEEISTYSSDTLRKYRLAFTTPAVGDEITSAALDIDPLKVGKALPNEGDIAKDSFKYLATVSNWYASGTVSSPSTPVPGNRVVKAGEKYILSIKLTPNVSSAFADNVEVTVNGKAAVRYGAVGSDGSMAFNVEMAPEESASGYILGDIDGDGSVTILDATYIQRELAGLTNQNPFVNEASDTDADGSLSILDATFIQRWLAGLSSNDNIGKPIS